MRESKCGQSEQKANFRGGVIAHNVYGKYVHGLLQIRSRWLWTEPNMHLHELTKFQLDQKAIALI